MAVIVGAGALLVVFFGSALAIDALSTKDNPPEVVTVTSAPPHEGPTPAAPNVRTAAPVIEPNVRVEGYDVLVSIAVRDLAGPSFSFDVDGLRDFHVQPAQIVGDGRQYAPTEKSDGVVTFLLAPSTSSFVVEFTAEGSEELNGRHSFNIFLYDRFGEIRPLSLTISLPQLTDLPAVEFTESADKQEVLPGEVVTYTMKITNTSDHDLNDVMVWQNPPLDYELIPGSTRAWSSTSNSTPIAIEDNWYATNTNLGRFPPGGSVWMTYQLKINSDVPENTVVWAVSGLGERLSAGFHTRSVWVRIVRPAFQTTAQVVAQGDESIVTIDIANSGSANSSTVLVAFVPSEGVRLIPTSSSFDMIREGELSHNVFLVDDWINTSNLGNMPRGYTLRVKFGLVGLLSGELGVFHVQVDELPQQHVRPVRQ